MSETTSSKSSFFKTVLETLASLSNGVLQSIWKILSPVTRNGNLFIFRPLDLLLPKKVETIEDGASASKDGAEEASVAVAVAKDASKVVSKDTPATTSPTSLFPSGEIKSLNSTQNQSKIGYPVACATSDPSAFDIIQLRNQNGAVVGWDFSTPSLNYNQYDQSQELFDSSNQNIILGIDNFDFINENTANKQMNSKLVMRRNRNTSNGSFPYSRYDHQSHNHNHNHNHPSAHAHTHAHPHNNTHTQPSPHNTHNQPSSIDYLFSDLNFELQHSQPQQQFTQRSDSINSDQSNLSDFDSALPIHGFNYDANATSSSELSPPELEILQSPANFYTTNEFNQTTSSTTIHRDESIPTTASTSSESPEIYPLNSTNQALFPVDQLNAHHNISIHGIYPLVHSRANSENGSPEHIANFNFDKSLEDVTWSGLNLPNNFTNTRADPNPILKQEDFHNPIHNSNELLPIISPNPLESWGYLPTHNNNHHHAANAILSPASVTSGSSLDIITGDESSPLSIASMGINSDSQNSSSTTNTSPVPSTSSDLPNQFSCPDCDASFRIKGYLTRHMKKHADQKAYTCPFFDPSAEATCHPSGGFSRRDTYKTHLKARHFVYPSGTRSEDRAKVGGHCGGCGIRFDSNERWVEDHIQMKECMGLVYKSG